MRRRGWLLYLLVSTYLVVRLVINRLVLGRWSVDAELLAVALGVGVAQLLVLELAPRLLRPAQAPGRDQGSRTEADRA